MRPFGDDGVEQVKTSREEVWSTAQALALEKEVQIEVMWRRKVARVDQRSRVRLLDPNQVQCSTTVTQCRQVEMRTSKWDMPVQRDENQVVVFFHENRCSQARSAQKNLGPPKKRVGNHGGWISLLLKGNKWPMPNGGGNAEMEWTELVEAIKVVEVVENLRAGDTKKCR
jgi:hypothetical protein